MSFFPVNAMTLFLLLVLVCEIGWSSTVRLNPLENNDKLQDINNQYVAEWQWESWPVKQDSSEKDAKWPGPRVNVALWKDSSGPNWYLFGGQPVNPDHKKIYSDVWKYSAKTRLWERFFPSPTEVKGTNIAKIGGLMTLRANLFDEGYKSPSESKNYNVILCGGVAKTNATKAKKQNVWSNFTRRKKQQQDEEEKEEKKELRSLAVYAPKTTTSNTVWQIDLKDKLWTAYVCCCDSRTSSSSSSSSEEITTVPTVTPTQNTAKTKPEDVTEKKLQKMKTTIPPDGKSDSLRLDKQPKFVGEVEDKPEQINPTTETFKNAKKKINQIKKSGETDTKKPIKKRNLKRDDAYGHTTEGPLAATSTEIPSKTAMTKKEKYDLKMKDIDKTNKVNASSARDKQENATEKNQKILGPKIAAKYCPEFSEGVEPVTWCDGNNEVLITADITSSQVSLWMFNLKTSHWSQKAVKVSNDVTWPGCSSADTVRYAGNEEEVYIICASVRSDRRHETKTSNETAEQPSNPSEQNVPLKKTVYKINYKKRSLESLGEIELSPYFRSLEGRKTWQNETESVLQVVRTSHNETVLLLAYLDSVDLWILMWDSFGRLRFETVEKIWRGSALKWFNKYNGPLYNFQFTTDSGAAETVLLPNPRIVGVNEYWPRNRGRFIIRLFKNENLKNQTFENRTREQNLTYQLLQSDYKATGSESQFNHNYSFKVVVFFGISLAIFTVFGFVMFLKRCVTCPPRIRTRNECQKSPLVIRYSVIPEDLFYPVA